jgi:hypothetical protein
MPHAFLLSPARVDGRRAQLLLNPSASFELATQLRSGDGAPLGEVFSFLSGLYFRGKLAYARAFGGDATFVITTDRGLVSPDVVIRLEDLRAFGAVDLAGGDERYIQPLRRDAERLRVALGPDAQVVLLGSIATGKYADVLTAVYGERLLFPTEFVGRGDMSRGGLLLRCVSESRELAYQPILGATRHGTRPPKLERRR